MLVRRTKKPEMNTEKHLLGIRESGPGKKKKKKKKKKMTLNP